MFCRTVRYSLSGSTVFLAGRYGKACRRVRYRSPGVRTRNNRRFCRTFVNNGSGPGSSVPKRRTNLLAGTVFFVREYGIDLLPGTVLEDNGWESILVGGYSILRKRSPGSKTLSLERLLISTAVPGTGFLAGRPGMACRSPWYVTLEPARCWFSWSRTQLRSVPVRPPIQIRCSLAVLRSLRTGRIENPPRAQGARPARATVDGGGLGNQLCIMLKWSTLTDCPRTSR